MRPGPPAVCDGVVWHRRNAPAEHAFTYDVSQVWIDPDEPEALCRLHPAWSASRPAPVRFRREDYGSQPAGSLANAARADLADVLPSPPRGPVRMLTQLRRWGWLFNPITLFVVWDEHDATTPQGAVLEVTNTPWKERHRYAVPLVRTDGVFHARFPKTLHVSPFLDEAYDYALRLQDRDDQVHFSLDVVPHEEPPTTDAPPVPVVNTTLQLHRVPASRSSLSKSLRQTPFPTHRVSVGIHAQAARLWAKRVPFISHPDKRTRPSRTDVLRHDLDRAPHQPRSLR